MSDQTPLDHNIAQLDGTPTTLRDLAAGRAVLLVNVASYCGFTPQYAGLQRLHEEYGADRLLVVGVPCNQFGAQEPGTPEEIGEFCSSTYGVTFPLTEKVEVNGENRHPIFADLVETSNEKGKSGDIAWNFEKFLLTADGSILGRFSTAVEPEDPRLMAVLHAIA
jgi:glutathione peroxidase